MIKMTAVAFVMVVLGITSCSIERRALERVQTGEVQLICNDRVIEPSLVVDYDGDRWYFTNGSMKNCELRN